MLLQTSILFFLPLQEVKPESQLKVPIKIRLAYLEDFPRNRERNGYYEKKFLQRQVAMQWYL